MASGRGFVGTVAVIGTVVARVRTRGRTAGAERELMDAWVWWLVAAVVVAVVVFVVFALIQRRRRSGGIFVDRKGRRRR